MPCSPSEKNPPYDRPLVGKKLRSRQLRDVIGDGRALIPTGLDGENHTHGLPINLPLMPTEMRLFSGLCPAHTFAHFFSERGETAGDII